MNYSKIAKSYNELYEEEQLKKLRIASEYLKITKKTRLLDVGCGTGISTNFFKCFAIGIDPCLDLLKQARTNFIRAHAENLPFRDKSFDVVVSFTAIHNFKNPERAIKEMKRVARKTVVITLLKRSRKYKKIKDLIQKHFKDIKEIDEEKDMIFIIHQLKSNSCSR